jgi:7-cyano-7-deazaguanine synthase
MRKNAVVLLSGGLDSATCCAIAVSEGFQVHALSFDYGQRHRQELLAARRVARFFSVKEHRIIAIDKSVFSGSALTYGAPVPKNRTPRQIGSGIPGTYVPARNTIFLSYAIAYAESIGSSDIFIGVNALDYSGYPAAFEAMANLATKAAVQGKKLALHAPLVNLTKAQIILKGMALGVDYSLTHSCYDPLPSGAACGACDSCALRRKGFREAGVEDPTRYGIHRKMTKSARRR